MSGSRVPPLFSARTLEARLTPSHEAKTLSMRLPWQELLAVEDAAKASGKTRSEWLREAVLAHLQKPIRSRKSAPDPTLLTELVGLRQLTVNLFAALASPEFSTATVQQVVKQADHVKEGKADEILRRLDGERESK